RLALPGTGDGDGRRATDEGARHSEARCHPERSEGSRSSRKRAVGRDNEDPSLRYAPLGMTAAWPLGIETPSCCRPSPVAAAARRPPLPPQECDADATVCPIAARDLA